MPGESDSPGQMKAGAPAKSRPLGANAGTQAEDALTMKSCIVGVRSEDGALSQGPCEGAALALQRVFPKET